MMLKPILLITPLIIVVLFFSFYSNTKDPYAIMLNAQQKMSGNNNYVINSSIIMDIGVIDSVMRYVSNATTASLGDEFYVRITTQTPFTDLVFINEEFILDEGNFSCTNSLLRPVCYQVTAVNDNNDLLEEDEYQSLEFLGSKTVNNYPCDAVLAEVNVSNAAKIIGGQVDENFSDIKSMFLYSCINPDNGIPIEMLWGIKGESNLGGFIMDIGINITKQVTSYSNEVPSTLFTLPYEVISQEEYDELVNQTEAAYNETLI